MLFESTKHHAQKACDFSYIPLSFYSVSPWLPTVSTFLQDSWVMGVVPPIVASLQVVEEWGREAEYGVFHSCEEWVPLSECYFVPLLSRFIICTKKHLSDTLLFELQKQGNPRIQHQVNGKYDRFQSDFCQELICIEMPDRTKQRPQELHHRIF